MAIRIAWAANYRRRSGMGAKYIPSVKDMKASQRFQQKQVLPKSLFKKPAAAQPAPKTKQK